MSCTKRSCSCAARNISASLYDKETDEWVVADFEVLMSALFAGKGETISRCSVQLHSKIVESINRRHVAIFNLARLQFARHHRSGFV